MTYRSLDTSERKYDFQHLSKSIRIHKMISFIKTCIYYVIKLTYNLWLVNAIRQPNLYPKPTQYNILTIYNNSLSLEFHTQVSDGIDIGEYRLS